MEGKRTAVSPRQVEVRAGVLKAAPAAKVTQGGPCVSMRACEMMAEVRVFQRE